MVVVDCKSTRFGFDLGSLSKFSILFVVVFDKLEIQHEIQLGTVAFTVHCIDSFVHISGFIFYIDGHTEIITNHKPGNPP